MKKNFYYFIAAALRLAAFLFLSIVLGNGVFAQNVGIGTNSPLRKFSVAGSILLDQLNQATGSLDSTALLFGTGGVGITSKKTGGVGQHGLALWTNGLERLSIAANGNIGIGGPALTSFKLRVGGGDVTVDDGLYVNESIYAYGNSAIGGDVDPGFKFRVHGSTKLNTMETSSNVTIGGELDPNYRLRVVNGDTRFGGDMHATGNVGFGAGPDSDYRMRVIGGNSFLGGDLRTTGNTSLGGEVDPAFRLRVWGGNSRFGGDVLVVGTTNTENLEVNNTVTINGKGSVRSNGPSHLRVGFDQRTVDLFLNGNEAITVNANITDFSGSNADVRVFLSQVEFLPGNSMWASNLHVLVLTVDNSENTVALRIRNLSNTSATLKATIYLTTIAKD